MEELFARLRAEAGAPPEPGAQPDSGAQPAPAAQPAADEGPAPVEAAQSRTPSDDVIESVRIIPATAPPKAASAPKSKSAAERAPKPEPRPAASSSGRPRSSGAQPSSGSGAEAPGVAVSSTVDVVAVVEVEVDEVDVEETVRVLDPAVVRRDEVLDPLVAGLARRLKRALQDDQNDILDRLRAKGGWAPGVLPSEEDHAQRYAQVAAVQLREAARAGATFAGGTAGDAEGVDDVAGSLAAEIVAPLRRRLEEAGPSVDEGDESALVELVGAAFREWKGARTERLAGDRTVFAFARAALGAVPAGTMLRWIVDDDVAHCPDCDDNALAGAVASPEEFPTGHRHPPAHAGCRCLLVPATA